MKIEEEIKQSSFKDEYQKLMINLLFTGKWIHNISAKHIKPFGLTNQQYNVLRILRGQKDHSISVNKISERMIDRMSNVSRLVDKLEHKKLVKRKVNINDRRQMNISISEKGIELVKEIEKKENELFSNFKALSTKEAKILNQLLDKLRTELNHGN